ncbi:MAG: DDE-type integrase/transposase/recombinase, partial [Oscillospiraceae bacterium]
PLLSPNLDNAALKELKAAQSRLYEVSERTLERYSKTYLELGFEGLQPQGHGNPSYKIPPDLLAEAVRLRQELPSRSVPVLIHILEMEGKAAPGFLKRTTLQDALAREGYSSSMMRVYQDNGYASQRFQRVHRHDLWQGDIKYGPILNLGGTPTQTYFSCLIDDATRYILHGEFYATMEQEIVEDTLHKAVTKHGVPKRIYFDNGSQYRTHWMKRACSLMGIRLLYAKPRNPQGKGKQERFNHTLDAFLEEISLHLPDTLAELNALFGAWLEECYHTVEHSALGTTPEIAFKSDSMPPHYMDTAVVARSFLHCEQRKADKCGCISFRGEKYDLGVQHAGKQVDVVYEPANTETLTIETRGFTPFQVHKLVVREHVAERPGKVEPPRVETDHSRLLDAAAQKQQQKDLRRNRAISYTSELEKV